MDFNFSILFGKTTNTDYDVALEYAAQFDKFIPISEESKYNIIETTNHEVLANFELLQKLLLVIKGFERVNISFNNKDISPDVFLKSIKPVVECYKGYKSAENIATYCDDKKHDTWGCRQLKGIVRNHKDYPYYDFAKYWYQYGSFINNNTWNINKDLISQALTEIIDLRCIFFCPIFQLVFFRKLLAELPAKIDLTDLENWDKIYLDSTISNVNRWEAVNVFHKSKETLVLKEGKSHKKHKDLSEMDLTDANTDELNLRYIPETNFSDVGGIEDIIQSIREVIELPIIKPELFDHLGIKPNRGILLWGEPGNGKTLIAKAIAHEVDAHFIPIAGPDILNKSFGESEKNIKEIFEEAREHQPSIIYIDEIDAIAQSRLAGETAKWYATVVNQLLTLMDGIREFGNVSVIASTNRPDLLDPALLRPGRFDYKLEVRRPKLHGVKTILDIATRDMPLADDVDLFSLAEAAVGYSAAEITFIAKEAAMSAMRRNVDIKAVLREEDDTTDFSHITIKQTDFFNALMILKWHSKYVNKTYSIK